MIDALLSVLGLALYLVILVRTEPAINRMHARTAPFLIRLTFALLATGSVGGMLIIAGGRVPTLPDLVIAAGIAALLLCERRARLISRLHTKGHPHAQG